MPNHTYPAIAAIADDQPRPLWSVMIPTFNCAAYLRATLESVLIQDPGPDQMQIEVVDDASAKDDPAAVVAEVGRGRVAFFRQAANLGNSRNFNTCLRRARGRLIHVLHGDDAVREGFYSTLGRALTEHPGVGAAFCRYISLDGDGHWQGIAPLEMRASGVLPGWLEAIASGQRLQPPCMVVRREAYERLGGFHEGLNYGEDWEMWVRIAAHYAVWYEPQPLACYRVHGTSLSARGAAAGANGADLQRAIALVARHQTPALARVTAARARKHFALACVRRAHRLFATYDAGAVLGQLRQALQTDHTPGVLARVAYAGLRWVWEFGAARRPAHGGSPHDRATRAAPSA